MSKEMQFEPNNLNWLQIVQQQVSAIRFGLLQLTVQNGEVVRIDASINDPVCAETAVARLLQMLGARTEAPART